MIILRFLFVALLIALVGCYGDKEPKLNIEGDWIVHHGLYEERCRISATITDKWVNISYETVEEGDGACEPETFGIEEDVLSFAIDSRSDFLDDDGAMAVTLELSYDAMDAEADVTLTESVEGMTAEVHKLIATVPGAEAYEFDILYNQAFIMVRQ